MEPTQAWIAPLIESCLSRYIKDATEQSNVENDESNLRFSISSGSSPYHALINSWPESGGMLMPNISDTKTQIDAILTRQSMEQYAREAPDKPLNKDSKGYWMELLDFEVVLEYSMSEPNVHLCVQRFTIVWDRKKFKGPPQGRKVKKNGHTQQLVRRVFEAVTNQAEMHNEPGLVASQQVENAITSQRNGAPIIGVTQELLLSQAPASLIYHSESGPSREQADRTTSSDKLLGRLRSHSDIGDHVTAPGQHFSGGSIHSDENRHGHEIHQRRLNNQGPIEASREYGVKNKADSESAAVSKTSVSNNPGNELKGSHSLEAPVALNGAVSRDEGSGSLDRNSPAGPAAGLPELSHPEDTTEGKEASKYQKEDTRRIVTEDMHSINQQADPWHGMTKIHKRDIEIPANQAKLLEHHERSWVPPSPGKSVPRACVPTELLTQWNEISLQRQRAANAKESHPKLTESESHEILFDPSPTTPGESSTDSVAYTWDESPDRNLGRPRQDLPEDSSPVKPRLRDHGPDNLHKAKVDPLPEETPEAVHMDGVTGESSQEETIFEPKSTNNFPDDYNIPGVNEVTLVSAKTDTIGYPEAHDDDSGAESEDSTMDTSVPCPLGPVSQAYTISQSDTGLSSSAPSLPGQTSREQVQVVETPAANFNRLRLIQATKRSAESKDDSSQPSPQCAKSSSQSRIINTYATHDSGPDGTQELSNPSQTNHGESNGIEIMGTQLSNGDWSMPDAMPFSSSGLISDSSAPKSDRRSPIPSSTYQSIASSKPCPSQDEMILSIESKESVQMAEVSQGPFHDVSMRDASPIRLKRPASGADSDDRVPAKRHRLVLHESERSHTRESTLPALDIVSRRQSYIRQSEDRAEAQTIFEKFRIDYPAYLGDFAHFAELCSKLQTLRLRGALQRSFLWDDFIIKHLSDYPRHIEDRLSAEAKTLPYEEWFASNFSRPSYKKRSLTAEAVKIAATQHESASRSNTVAIPPRNEGTTSFTGSLVERFSNFHTYSFGPADLTPSIADIDRMSSAISSPVPPVKVRAMHKVSTPESDMQSSVVMTSPANFQPDDIDQTGLDTGSVIAETDSEDTDSMDETHEIASVELGGEEPAESNASLADSITREVSEDSESDTENWFTSLRHIRNPGPGWWDDKNTAIKKWAKADQNVLSERVTRPGWARTPVDGKGVIQPWR